MTRLLALIFVFTSFVCYSAREAVAQTTEFTYQGSLKDGANLANGPYDFEFALYDGGGSQLGAALTRNGVVVANGIFSVSLDFGNQFPGAGRLLEIRVRISGGGGFTTLSPRQPVSSAPYSVKSLTADSATNATNAINATTAATAINAVNATNATNAVNATTAANFTGALAGDVTGTQSATTVARLLGRTVANSAPTNGQVLKFNSGTNQWQPDTDLIGGGGGGGTITGVTAGTGLSGGGTTGSVTLNIAPGGVGSTELATNAVTTAKIADANVTDAKIASVAGSKITGSITTATLPGANVTGAVANATTATTATTATNFTGSLAGDVTGTQNATTIASNAVTTTKLADSAVTATKIANGQVVKSINGLTDGVTLAAGSNVTITPSGNTLTIASTGGTGNSINNQTTPQAGANFNIDGVGTATTFNAVAQYNINGAGRILSSAGSDNLFAGIGAGNANPSGGGNTFVGGGAGGSNTSGANNSFVGANAGQMNTFGNNNTFVGINSGQSNTLNGGNTFVGANAGNTNTIGSGNTVIGFGANVGANNLSSATAIGFNAIVTQSNSIVLGSNLGSTRVGIGTSTPADRLTVQTATTNYGFTHTDGTVTVGSFVGGSTGGGWYGTKSNHPLSFFTNNGAPAMTIATNGYVGIGTTTPSARLDIDNSSDAGIGLRVNGLINGIQGESRASVNGVGVYGINDFGGFAGYFRGKVEIKTATTSYGFTHTDGTVTVGSFVGGSTGGGWYGTRSNHSLSFFVNNGPASLTISTDGLVNIPILATQGGAALCRNGPAIAFCSSSLRYKKNISRFSQGMSFVNKLRPISFDWKKDGTRDVGFGAEDIAKIDERFVTYNDKGEVEGVKYDRLSVAFVNAFKEQQTQIAQQQKQIATLLTANAALSRRVRTVEKRLPKKHGSAHRRH